MKYKISQLAKLLGVSTNTVRRYENNGYIQAQKEEGSIYSYYDDDGVFGITNAKVLRKYGFTHEQLHDMKNMTINEMLATYRERMEDMDKQIAYMTYVRHRLKDDYLLMQKAATYDGVYEKQCNGQVYVLYKEGEQLLQEPKRLEKMMEFLYDSPEVQHVYVIPKQDLDRGNVRICCGWSVKDMHMEKYHMTENEYTVHYPATHSVMGIVKLPDTLEELAAYSAEEMKHIILAKHLAYMQEHDLVLVGDILGVVITKVREENKNSIYMLLSLPVCAKEQR